MFISRREKEELYDGIGRLSIENECLEARMIGLETLFKTLVEINGDEINAKIKEINKTIYTGFRDLFIGDDGKVQKREAKTPKKQKQATTKEAVNAKNTKKSDNKEVDRDKTCIKDCKMNKRSE